MAIPQFTMTLHDKTNDFLLNTGIPSTKMDDELLDKINKCNCEYLPHKKSFRVPKDDLCTLLDECFDYFSEDSLINIAKLLDNAKADEKIVKEVREKSVSKSKQQKPLDHSSKSKKKEEKLKPIDEKSPQKNELEVEKEADKEREVEVEKETEKSKKRVDTPTSSQLLSLFQSKLPKPAELEVPTKGPKVAFEDDSMKETLLAYVDEVRMKLDKLERFVHKNL